MLELGDGDGEGYYARDFREFFVTLLSMLEDSNMDQRERGHGGKEWGKKGPTFPHKLSPGYRYFRGKPAIQL